MCVCVCVRARACVCVSVSYVLVLVLFKLFIQMVKIFDFLTFLWILRDQLEERTRSMDTVREGSAGRVNVKEFVALQKLRRMGKTASMELLTQL